MDITKLVVSGREKARLYGGWEIYRKQLTTRIHTLRKKLRITSKSGTKYTSKPSITAEDIGRSHEFVHLLLLTSERAWANAMSIREAHSTEKKGITGQIKSHLISRLCKATLYAKNLHEALQDQNVAGAVINDILEARAYYTTLLGAMEFEKQHWESCVKCYAEARTIYCALGTATRDDIFKDMLSDPVDQSIRYSAYQMRMPRTIAVDAIAREYFPRSDTELVDAIEKLDPDFLQDQLSRLKLEGSGSEPIPKTITWRSRTVSLEDAAISTALVSINTAVKRLTKILATVTVVQTRERASAYDEVLTASQDAVDATKHGIDELSSEGVSQGDQRMQSLLITRTALCYEMISWRIGRNRVLIGHQDGAIDAPSIPHPMKENSQKPLKSEGTSRKLARIREKVVLYDAILQSLESIKELPGIAADISLSEELDVKYEYFSSLKCLALARSHSILKSPRNTLALLSRASDKCNAAHAHLSLDSESNENSPPKISVTPAQVQFLKLLLEGEVRRYRALVEVINLSEMKRSEDPSNDLPLIERLNEYPTGEIDLSNLVVYPPMIEPSPVKPLFFDVAWNYIKYPGKDGETVGSGALDTKYTTKDPERESQAKKGWFGFGR